MKTFQRTTSSAGRRAMRVNCSTQNTTSSRSPAATGGVRYQLLRCLETSDGPSRGMGALSARQTCRVKDSTNVLGGLARGRRAIADTGARVLSPGHWLRARGARWVWVWTGPYGLRTNGVVDACAGGPVLFGWLAGLLPISSPPMYSRLRLRRR